MPLALGFAISEYPGLRFAIRRILHDPEITWTDISKIQRDRTVKRHCTHGLRDMENPFGAQTDSELRSAKSHALSRATTLAHAPPHARPDRVSKAIRVCRKIVEPRLQTSTLDRALKIGGKPYLTRKKWWRNEGERTAGSSNTTVDENGRFRPRSDVRRTGVGQERTAGELAFDWHRCRRSVRTVVAVGATGRREGRGREAIGREEREMTGEREEQTSQPIEHETSLQSMVFQLAAHPPFPASDKGWGKELGQNKDPFYITKNKDGFYIPKAHHYQFLVIWIHILVKERTNGASVHLVHYRRCRHSSTRKLEVITWPAGPKPDKPRPKPKSSPKI
ncbi:hypothetical protein Prudu_018518 [Prunus dulcis]|uniref:Uncharacterized protein n=1 Tax=Prunus dulcis TaxID=3755 RepID=A0A4Y1RR09_PRUDU|nr:hypothetical protein Prudu_018518 [Prunus dulcis]